MVALDLRTVAAAPSVTAALAAPAANSPVIADVSGHRRIIEDFVEAIGRDRAPLIDGREARRSLAVIEAMYRSAASGLPAEVPG